MPRGRDRNGRQIRPPQTLLPYRRIVILGLILLLNNSSIWMILSFLPSVTFYFDPQLSVSALGYRVGYLGAAFSGGSLFGNILWGVLADKYGRRIAILAGLILSTIAAVMFGFSPSFLVAIIFRFLWGFVNGNIGVSKTYIGEILDDSNTAKGMALLGVIGGLGRFLGPLLGGYLSFPARRYSIFKETIFDRYPLSLPSIVIAVNCFVVLAFAYLELPETLKSKMKVGPLDKKKGLKMKKILRRGNTEYSQLSSMDYENEIDKELEDIGEERNSAYYNSIANSSINGNSDYSPYTTHTSHTAHTSHSSHPERTMKPVTNKKPILFLRLPSQGGSLEPIEHSKSVSTPTTARIENAFPDHFRVSPDPSGSNGTNGSSEGSGSNGSGGSGSGSGSNGGSGGVSMDNRLMRSHSSEEEFTLTPEDAPLMSRGGDRDGGSGVRGGERGDRGGERGDRGGERAERKRGERGFEREKDRLERERGKNGGDEQRNNGNNGIDGSNEHNGHNDDDDNGMDGIDVHTPTRHKPKSQSQSTPPSGSLFDRIDSLILDIDEEEDGGVDADGICLSPDRRNKGCGKRLNRDREGDGGRDDGRDGGREGRGGMDGRDEKERKVDWEKDVKDNVFDNGFASPSRRVSFSSLVMVKVIGSSSLGIGQLKHLRPEDQPVDDNYGGHNGGHNGGGGQGGLGGNGGGLGGNEGHLDASDAGGMEMRSINGGPSMTPTRYSNGSELNTSLAARNGSLSQRVRYLLGKRQIFVSTFMYGTNGLVQLVFSEMFPLWLVTPKDLGGFGFDGESLVSAIVMSAILTVFLQLSVYPIIVENYGVLKTYRFGCNLFSAVVFSMPLISFLKGHSESEESVWAIVVLSMTLMGTATMFTLISIFILINNSCYSHERATVNGIGQIFVSFGRLCGPFIVAYMVTWNGDDGRTDWAFNYFILGAVSLLNSRLALLLPRSMERRKREPREPRYTYSPSDRGDEGDEDCSEMEELIAEEPDPTFEDSPPSPYTSHPTDTGPYPPTPYPTHPTHSSNPLHLPHPPHSPMTSSSISNLDFSSLQNGRSMVHPAHTHNTHGQTHNTHNTHSTHSGYTDNGHSGYTDNGHMGNGLSGGDEDELLVSDANGAMISRTL